MCIRDSCISSILSTFFVIILTALLIDIYRITVEVAVQDNNIIHQIFVIVVASLCLIDGPNLVERLFGIDAGLTSGFRTVGSLFIDVYKRQMPLSPVSVWIPCPCVI